MKHFLQQLPKASANTTFDSLFYINNESMVNQYHCNCMKWTVTVTARPCVLWVTQLVPECVSLWTRDMTASKKADLLTQIEIDEIKKHYDQLVKGDEDNLPAPMVPTLMRFLGQNPTNEEVKDIIETVNTQHNGSVNFDTFLEIWVNRKKTRPELTDSLREAFRYFDKDNRGYVEVTELKKSLTDIGDKMSESEFDEMCKEAGVNKSGKIEYEEFIKIIMASNPTSIL
ncbi:uncharacterized protein LOC135485533 isoform X2 [Lineus longissimus]|uniref:uncharacterized protein LOC135485533 isoform X2 n=1 Tax=Lineus longissimus TaxID=88925 RepID=UPI002B4DBD5D